MKLRSFQNMSVEGFGDPEILIVFRDHQLINGLQYESDDQICYHEKSVLTSEMKK